MTTEETDEYFREAIRRLEEEKARLNAEKARLDRDKTYIDYEAEQRRSELDVALGRANHPPLSNDICPSCWIYHAEKVILQPPHGTPDRVVCSKCGYEELRKA